MAVSCASDTEPESNEMTLAERAGVYANVDNIIMLVLRTDGTGTYVNAANAVLQLIIGSSDSAYMSFKAVTTADKPVFKTDITFDSEDSSTVEYISIGTGTGTLEKVKF